MKSAFLQILGSPYKIFKGRFAGDLFLFFFCYDQDDRRGKPPEFIKENADYQ